LQERRLVESERGKIAVGWLIVEDLAMVLALVLIPALAASIGGQRAGGPSSRWQLSVAARPDMGIGGIIGMTLAKVGAFVIVMLIVGRRVIPWTMHHYRPYRLARTVPARPSWQSRSASPSCRQAVRRLAGARRLLCRHDSAESELSHRAAQEACRFATRFAVLFFVSVGMLFDPHSLLDKPAR
jgi:CPA2 family monovalent cation:H+ antiporter-2